MSRYHLHGAELHRQTRSRTLVVVDQVRGHVRNIEAALERFAKRPGLTAASPSPSTEPGAGGTFDGGR